MPVCRWGHDDRIDILVNNAGGIVRRAHLEELTESLLDEVMRLNFTSVVLMCQAVIPRMVKCGAGRVINISSIAGHTTYTCPPLAISSRTNA